MDPSVYIPFGFLVLGALAGLGTLAIIKFDERPRRKKKT